MPSVSVHFRTTPAGTAHSTAMPASAPARLPVRMSPAPTLVAVSRIAGPTADSRGEATDKNIAIMMIGEMKQLTASFSLCLLFASFSRSAEPIPQSVIDGFKLVEVASVADAMEQLYGQRAHMSHDMRPVFMTKFAGPAVTVQLKREEHKDGAPA